MTIPGPPRTARVTLDPDRVVGEIPPLLFSGFAEHMGRCIYGGVFEPGSPLADERGFRRDTLEALRELNCRSIRYPGGNFVSGYDWLDGVGPRESRPVRRDLAWQSLETNQFGTNEFMDFCREIGTLPMLAVNLGTGAPQDAANLVEYCNAPAGSKFADLRVSHGYPQPHNVKHWCLGNEMDGPWQIGALGALEYGLKAQAAARLMRLHDPGLELVLVGSSLPSMPTYPEWDRLALETAWDEVDYLSMHYYADNRADDTASYLALPVLFEDHVDAVAATLRYVKAKRRSKRDVHLSWDEWNVSYKVPPVPGEWRVAPPLVEEVFNLEDALVVAQWLSVFLRRCDVLKITCVSMLLNVAGPLLSSKTGLLRQTTFYPMMLFSRHAAGVSLEPAVRAPTQVTQRFGEVSTLDVSASFDAAQGRGAVFLVNRSLTDPLETEVLWREGGPSRVETVYQASGTDPKAANSFERPDALAPRMLPGFPVQDGRLTVTLPPLSYTVLLTRQGATT